MLLLKRVTLLSMIAGVFLVLSACEAGQTGEGAGGQGAVQAETREVNGFSSVTLNGIGHVLIRQTTRESLTVRAEADVLPRLESRVAGGTLILGVVPNTTVRTTHPIEFIVEAKDINGLTVTGAGDIEAGGIETRHLSVSIEGTGNVTVSGSVDDLEVDISGAGGYAGEELQAAQATVHSDGTGNAIVRVSDRLDAAVSGLGSVEYIGAPEVHTSISGLGKVTKR